jgi:hypothetical protein
MLHRGDAGILRSLSLMIPSSPRLVAFAQSECDLTTPIVRWIVVSSLQTCQSTSGYTTHGSRCSEIEMCAACPRGARRAGHARRSNTEIGRRAGTTKEPLTRVTAGRSHTRSRRKRAYTSPLRRRQVGGGPTLERAKSTHYRHAYQHVK